MDFLSKCKSLREILQLTRNFTITNATGNIFTLADIENFTVTSIVAAEGKAMVTLADEAGDVSALAIDVIDKNITIYSLES